MKSGRDEKSDIFDQAPIFEASLEALAPRGSVCFAHAVNDPAAPYS